MRRSALERPHFLWLDNYAKVLARSVPTLDVGAYNGCYWTGSAMFPSGDDSIDDSLKYTATGQIVPAMPDDLLDYSANVQVAVAAMQGPRAYLSDSIVARYNVRNVPPKVDTKVWPELHSTINCATNRLADIQPQSLFEENIGSNLGLLCILRRIYEDKGMHDGSSDRYLSINVDENIYYRTLKVHLLMCAVQ